MPPAVRFERFSDLLPELQRKVLAFVAEGPFEQVRKGIREASLNFSLPLVSKSFHQMSKTFWHEAYHRAIANDGMWKLAAKGYQEEANNPETDFAELYYRVFTERIEFRGPVFIMQMSDVQDHHYELCLFEPRYRIMIEQLLHNYHQWQEDEANQGPPPPMYFMHANDGLPSNMYGSISPLPTVLLVQILECIGMRGGHYRVRLKVVGKVQTEHFWVEPNTANLVHARGRRYVIYDTEDEED